MKVAASGFGSAADDADSGGQSRTIADDGRWSPHAGRDTELQRIVDIASAYYIDGATQEEISHRFGLSRAKVGRLLKRARDEGVVDIRVRYHPELSKQLEHQLIERFGLDRALIAPDQSDTDVQRSIVAGLVASYLSSSVTDGTMVAVGMGRNVGAVTDHLHVLTPVDAYFVCAIGGALKAGENFNADHICRRIAAAFGGKSETLYAPAYVADLEARDHFLKNDTIRQTMDRARRADIALIGIGDLSEQSNIVRMGWFTPEEIAQSRLTGTIGDLMGYNFYDIHGKPTNSELQRRVVGLSTEELRRIPNVIAIAAEPSKTLALLGALRSGVINTLATSATNADTILKLDTATGQAG